MRREWVTTNAGQTEQLARQLGQRVGGGTVIALHGPLGAGKTCFVRGLATGLGLDAAQVSSPTFIICQEYRSPGGSSLAHVDAYRLSDPVELETIGWEELLDAPDVVVAVEWAERIASAMPEGVIDVRIEPVGADARRITMSGANHAGEIAGLQVERGQSAACPVCSAPVTTNSDAFPFCSDRCRLADLGQWLKGGYTISRPFDDDDFA